jgi:hypothetical protein
LIVLVEACRASLVRMETHRIVETRIVARGAAYLDNMRLVDLAGVVVAVVGSLAVGVGSLVVEEGLAGMDAAACFEEGLVCETAVADTEMDLDESVDAGQVLVAVQTAADVAVVEEPVAVQGPVDVALDSAGAAVVGVASAVAVQGSVGAQESDAAAGDAVQESDAAAGDAVQEFAAVAYLVQDTRVAVAA